MWLVAVAEAESVLSNPLSDLVYDLVPILAAVGGGGALAFRKRLAEWSEDRRLDRVEPIVEKIVERVVDDITTALVERDTALAAALGDIAERLPPSAAEAAAALEVVRQGVAAGVVAVDALADDTD